MLTTITEQQGAFFTQNGYIELEGIPMDIEVLFEKMRSALASRFEKGKVSSKTAEERYAGGRDLWRLEPLLESLWRRKLSHLALKLTGKKQLRLALDQWIPIDLRWDQMIPAKDLFGIQGLAICALLSSSPASLSRKSKLGLLPLPSKPGHVLFFKPTLLLDWPSLTQSASTDLYLGAYALPSSVYVENRKDPSTHMLKQFGYGFGDVLKNEFHPLIYEKHSTG